MIKVGQCILVKQQGKWRCVKYYKHDNKHLYYVEMPKEMQYKRNIKKMAFDKECVRSIYEGKGEQPRTRQVKYTLEFD